MRPLCPIREVAGCLLLLIPLILQGQALVINEALSSNQGSLMDADGDTPDWLELHNGTDTAIDLDGYCLSDKLDDLDQWTFTDTLLQPNSHLLIMASGKDRQPLRVDWDPVIQAGTGWSYLPADSEPPANWNTLDFIPQGWSYGAAGIGYGDNDDQTVIDPTLSLYMRTLFRIEDRTEPTAVLFHMDFDDGYVAYLNGTEIQREFLGNPGDFIAFDTPADDWCEAALYQGIALQPTMVDPALLRPGFNVLAVQVHNHNIGSSDLSALPFLTLGRDQGSSEALHPLLELPDQTEFHTNFRISTSGETLFLSDATGLLVDSLLLPPLPADISYGHSPDGSTTLRYFNLPTPGGPNGSGVTVLTPAPELAPAPGFYSTAVTVSLLEPVENTTYHYTLDGTLPTAASPTFSGSPTFTENAVLRIMAIPEGEATGPLTSATYFVDEPSSLPVVSLIFEPADFFDVDSGIYAEGTSASPEFPHFGANFWEDWERPLHLEFFEDENAERYATHAGVKIFGGWSRGFPQKSLSLFARGRYGSSEFAYPFFPDLDLETFEALVLRNSGNDWNSTGFRDGLLTGLVDPLEMEKQAFRPVAVYFNGSFWGHYNLREKVNEHFVADHRGVEVNDIDLLELNGLLLHGDNQHYQDLITFIETEDLTVPMHYEYVQDRMDVTNFIQYQAAQIYFDNRDWPGNNIKFWRPALAGGKWRWILFDTDFGFGIWNPYAYQENTLAFALDPAGPGWPNPPWSTLMLRRLVENPDFRREFILSFNDLLNDLFRPAVVQARLDAIQSEIEDTATRGFSRWGHNTVSNWNTQVNAMRTFAQNRQGFARSHLQQVFDLGALHALDLDVFPTDGGSVRVHSMIPETYPWLGHFFADYPVDFEAIPAPGYRFSHWEGTSEAANEILLQFTSSRALTAVFEPESSDDAQIVINEINYHSPDEQDSGDWVELVNAGTATVNLNGWSLSDGNDDNRFDLPHFDLEPGQYLVLCHDSLGLRTIHGSEFALLGDFTFNFSNGGENVRLFSFDGTLVDSVHYDDASPWPTEPDGDGPTLELIHPDLDNTLATHWAASDGHGTPGARNSRWALPQEAVSASLPYDFSMLNAFPNPFNAQLNIPLSLPQAGAVQLWIFDLSGRLVYGPHSQALPAGKTTLQWDAHTNDLRPAAAGIYLVRAGFRDQTSNQKVVLLK